MSLQRSISVGRLTAMAAGAALTAVPALGQGAGGDDTGLTEITVTARKVEERLIDVPLTISAVSAKDIEAAGFTSIRDIAESTPGLFISSSQGRSGDRISMRGINTVSPTQGYVGVYVDGVFVGSSSAQGVELSNVERVEVLKGPQSALFGRSTLSGAINYVTRRPGREFEGQVNATLGERSRRDLSALLSGPIGETTSFLLGARDFSLDGEYVNNFDGGRNIGGQSTTNGTLGLLWKPSDAFDAYLRVLYTKDADEQVAVGAQGALANNCLRATPTGIPTYYCGELRITPADIFLATSNGSIALPLVGRYTASDGEAGMDRKATRTSLELNWDLGFAKLSSISAYTSEEQRDAFDLTYRAALTYAAAVGLPAITFDRTFEYTDKSQELRLVGQNDGPFGWLAGVYWFDNERSEVATYRLPAAAANAGTLGATNIAGYGRLEYDLTDRLSVAAEARWQRDEIEYDNPVNLLAADAKTNSVLPRATVDFKVNDDLMIYAVYSEGSKPVTINTAPELPAQLRFTREEEAKNYELGLKGRFLDGRLTLLTSAFYIDWTNQESQGICLPGECGGVQTITRYVTNFGETSVRGFEVEATGELIRDWLTLRLGYSMNDTRIGSGRTNSATEATEGILAYGTSIVQPICAPVAVVPMSVASPYCPAAQSLQGANYVGLDTSIPAQPEYHFSAAATLGHALGSTGLRWSARADYIRLSKQYEGFFNLNYVGPRENLGLRFTLSGEKWDLTLWGRNVTDDDTPTTILRSVAFKDDDGTAGPRTANSRAFVGFLPESRNFGVTGTYRF